MSAGHIAMTFDQSFLLALLALVVGSGFLKGNISAQVGGGLSPRRRDAAHPRLHHLQHSDQHRRRRRPHRVRSARATLWLALRLRRGRDLHARRPGDLPLRLSAPAGAGGAATRSKATRLTAAERRIVYALIAVIVITIFQTVAYSQVFNVSPIWIQQHVALEVGGFRIPVPWYQAMNAGSSIVFVPLLFWIWRQQAARGREPDELGQDRHGLLGRGGQQPDPGGGHPCLGRCADPSDLADPLLSGSGHLLPVLLAHAARARLAHRAGQA